MTTGPEFFLQAKAGSAAQDSMSQTLSQPDDVLDHPSMSVTEKRALLASWASDARAVPGVPILRQLDDGSIVIVDEILRALKALDGLPQDEKCQDRPGKPWRTPFDRRQRKKWTSWVRQRRRDDDDDPPPCPAYAAVPPRRGDGGTIAYPELATA
jgi:hypothetical protein